MTHYDKKAHTPLNHGSKEDKFKDKVGSDPHHPDHPRNRKKEKLRQQILRESLEESNHLSDKEPDHPDHPHNHTM